jgi:hypothetical protein
MYIAAVQNKYYCFDWNMTNYDLILATMPDYWFN